MIDFKKKFKEDVYAISCVSDEGFDALKEVLLEAVLSVRKAEQELEDEGKAQTQGKISDY